MSYNQKEIGLSKKTFEITSGEGFLSSKKGKLALVGGVALVTLLAGAAVVAGLYFGGNPVLTTFFQTTLPQTMQQAGIFLTAHLGEVIGVGSLVVILGGIGTYFMVRAYRAQSYQYIEQDSESDESSSTSSSSYYFSRGEEDDQVSNRGSSCDYVFRKSFEEEIKNPLLSPILPKDGASIEGRTPLHQAVERGDISLMQQLCKDGAKVDAQDRLGITPLHLAAYCGNIEASKILLDHGAVDNEAQVFDCYRNTPYHYAADQQQVKFFSALMDEMGSNRTKGNREVLNTNLENQDDRKPKALLEKEPQKRLTQLLTDSVHIREPEKRESLPWKDSPLMIAVKKQDVEQVKALYEKDAFSRCDFWGDKDMGKTPLHYAVLQENEEILTLLLRNRDKGLNIDAVDRDGNTALHLLAQAEDFNRVGKLIAYAPDPTIKNRQDLTPAQCTKDAVIKDFLSKKKQEWTLVLSQKTKDPKTGMTPLLKAVAEDNLEELNKAIEAGALRFGDAHKDNQSRTPFHIAALKGYKEVLKILEEKKAHEAIDINAKDKYGNTALHYAAMNQDREFVKILIDLGAARDVKNKNDEIPASLASKYNSSKVADYLRQQAPQSSQKE